MTTAPLAPAADSYDEVPYPSAPYHGTHPANVAALARLFGMDPPDPQTARVLELGCASGGNLAPMAVDYPQATLVGIDLSSRQIDMGRELLAPLNLTNLELRRQSILDFDAPEDSLDYILCHGVYSWVPRAVQDKILAIARKCLSPRGVIYVSYNTYPGWHLRGIVRDMMRWHADNFASPQDKIAQSRELLKFLLKSAKSRTTAYQQVLSDEAEIISSTSDSYLYHEHLESVNEPLYFHQYVQRLAAAELQYLAESELAGMLSENLSPDLTKLFERTPLAHQEQYMDFITNRMFRCTLACRRGVALTRDISPQRLHGLCLGLVRSLEAPQMSLASDEPAKFERSGQTVTAKAPITKAALAVLAENYPRALMFDDLLERARQRLQTHGAAPSDATVQQSQLAADMLRLVGRGILRVALNPPPFVTTVSPRPLTTPLARLQAATGLAACRLHYNVALKPLGKVLLPLLDGRHDKAALAEGVRVAHHQGAVNLRRQGERIANPEPELLSRLVEQTLAELAREALLVG